MCLNPRRNRIEKQNKFELISCRDKFKYSLSKLQSKFTLSHVNIQEKPHLPSYNFCIKLCHKKLCTTCTFLCQSVTFSVRILILEVVPATRKHNFILAEWLAQKNLFILHKIFRRFWVNTKNKTEILVKSRENTTSIENHEK